MKKSDLKENKAADSTPELSPEDRINELIEKNDHLIAVIDEYKANYAKAIEMAEKHNQQEVRIGILRNELKIAKKRIKNIFKYMKMVGVDQTFLVNISKLAFKVTKKGKAYFPKTIKNQTWKN